MAEHNFRLLLEADSLSDEQVDRAYGRGLHDLTFGERAGRAYVGVDREAPTFADAVVSAIEDVERTLQVPVYEVEPEEYVFASEIADRIGRTRQNISQLIEGARGPSDFPAAAQQVGTRKLWRWSEVAAWFARYEGRDLDSGHREIIEVVNGFLAERRARQRLDGLDSRERSPLERLARQMHERSRLSGA